MNSSRIRKIVLVCMILLLTLSFPFMAALADDQKAPDEQKAADEQKPP